MRPRLIEALRGSGLDWVAFLVPTPPVVYALAFLVVVALFVQRSRQVSLSTDRAVDAALLASAVALVGARVYFLAVHGLIAYADLRTWFSWEGTASWGAYLGAMLGLTCYLRTVRVSPLPYLDVAASCAGLGIFVGRWSCLLNGDDFGRISTAPWAIRYPVGSLPYAAQISAGSLAPGAELSLPAHPLQIYLALNGLVIFFMISALWRRRRHIPGLTLTAFWVLYTATRFFWEFLRDPSAGGARSLLSSSQVMCLVLFAASVALMVYRHLELRTERFGPR